MAEKKEIILSPPKLPAVPQSRVKDPTQQRAHDAVKETLETMRGTRGSPLDRAVFIRDLVATGLLSYNASTGGVGSGPALPPVDDDPGSNGEIPPALQNIVATAGFSYILLTWNDPHYNPLAYYEVYRRRVIDPSDDSGFTPDDARITPSEQAELAALIDNGNRTAVETRLMNALSALNQETTDFDYAKNAWLQYPDDEAIEEAYQEAGEDLKHARLIEQAARYDDTGSAMLMGRTVAPVFSDSVDRGTSYLYWVRAVSRAGIPGPFNPNGVLATTQPDISGIIDELTSEINRGAIANLIFNGLDSPPDWGPDPGRSLLEILTALHQIADQARSDASDALASVISTIPPSIWQAIHDLYNTLASTVLGSVIAGMEDRVDLSALNERLAAVERTQVTQADENGAVSATVTDLSAQFETQFAEIRAGQQVLADADTAMATDITVLEGAVYDPMLGTIASHARIDDVENLTVDANSALMQRFSLLAGQVASAQGQISDILSLQIAPDSALAARLTQLDIALAGATASISDLLSLSISDTTALGQKLTSLSGAIGDTQGQVRDILNLNITTDSLLAQSLRQLEGAVAGAQGSISELLTLQISADSVLAVKLTRLEGQVGESNGRIDDILDLRITPDSVLAVALTDLEGAVADTQGSISDLLALEIDPNTVLAGKLTTLTADTGFAVGAVEDMLSLRLDSTALMNTAFAGKLTEFEVALGGINSQVQTFVYDQIDQLKDEDGNLADPVARAGWGVRIEQTANGQSYVSGFGLNQDLYYDPDGVATPFSEFVIAANRFAIIDPSNPDIEKNAPFIVAADPDTGAMKVWLRDGMIQRASIADLIAGNVVADMVRAGAFVQTARLNAPQINIGNWTPGPTYPEDPFDWTWDESAGRQGNFSVDTNGVMHATDAVLHGLLITDGAYPTPNVVMDARHGTYTSAIANGSLYLNGNGTMGWGSNGAVPGQVVPLEAYHGAHWDFSGTVEGWTGVACTLSASSTTLAQSVTGADPQIWSPSGLAIVGATYNRVRARVRRTSGTGAWAGTLYYTNGAHGFSESYKATAVAPADVTQWTIVEWDLSSLADWTTGTTTRLRIDLSDAAASNWEVDWVAVGKTGGAEWAQYSINPSNPITDLNIGTYIAQLAVGTLHIAGNAITVPQFVNTPNPNGGVLPTPGVGSWSALTSVTVLLNATGYSAADANIPILITWGVEALGENENAARRQYRIRRSTPTSAVVWEGNVNMRSLQDFTTGQVQATVNAGVSTTFVLETSGDAARPCYSANLSTVTVRR